MKSITICLWRVIIFSDLSLRVAEHCRTLSRIHLSSYNLKGDRCDLKRLKIMVNLVLGINVSREGKAKMCYGETLFSV